MLDVLMYAIPLSICLLISLSLIALFRRELSECVREFFCSLVMHSCIAIAVMKDAVNRRSNTVEIVSWPAGVAVITGARGIGFEVIKKLLASGMTVIIGCRDVAVGETTVSKIRDSGVTNGSAKVYRLDLSSMNSVKIFAQQVLDLHQQLHLLVNNAGTSMKRYNLTEDRVEETLSTNYLGHFYLTHLLLARMADTAAATGVPARVVNVASVVHRFPFLGRINFQDINLREGYEEYTAYSQSKLCQVMFTATLNNKLRQEHVPVIMFAVHPGIVHTGMVTKSIAHRIGGCLYPVFLRNAEQGSRAVYYACVNSDLESTGGAYIYSCAVTPTGKSAQSEESQAKLWKITMDMLKLKRFGNLVT